MNLKISVLRGKTLILYSHKEGSVGHNFKFLKFYYYCFLALHHYYFDILNRQYVLSLPLLISFFFLIYYFLTS